MRSVGSPNWIPRLNRRCFSQSAYLLAPKTLADTMITSPPHMRQLDYARDNRLRLWFLGIDDPHALDKAISPRKEAFFETDAPMVSGSGNRGQASEILCPCGWRW